MTAEALRDSVKGLNAEDSHDDLAEAVVRMEGEKPFGLPGISVPHSLELSATIQREVEWSVGLENFRDFLVVVVGFEWTETFFAAGEKLDGIFTTALSASETLDEAHGESPFCYSLDKGKKKAPCQTSTGPFLSPFGAV